MNKYNVRFCILGSLQRFQDQHDWSGIFGLEVKQVDSLSGPLFPCYKRYFIYCISDQWWDLAESRWWRDKIKSHFFWKNVNKYIFIIFIYRVSLKKVGLAFRSCFKVFIGFKSKKFRRLTPNKISFYILEHA